MHFAQLISAAIALPALSMAAAVPREFVSCSNYNSLTVGKLHVNLFHLQLIDSINVQIRAPGSGEQGWRTIANVPKGQYPTIDTGSNPGSWNLRMCDSLAYPQGGDCVYPFGGSATKIWDFKNTGDRWPFSVYITNAKGEAGANRVLQSECSVEKDLKVTDVYTPPAATTTTQSSTSPKASPTPSTTSSRQSSTIVDRTSTTSRPTSTRTSTSTRATSTTTRRNN